MRGWPHLWYPGVEKPVLARSAILSPVRRGGTEPTKAARAWVSKGSGERHEMAEVARDLVDVLGNRKTGEAIFQARAYPAPNISPSSCT